MNARSTDATELFKDACAGDRAALARLLSLIERGGDDARSVGRLVYPKIGKGYVVGLTGAPGAGKSTLTSALISHVRSLKQEVSVLAIDPSSPPRSISDSNRARAARSPAQASFNNSVASVERAFIESRQLCH